MCTLRSSYARALRWIGGAKAAGASLTALGAARVAHAAEWAAYSSEGRYALVQSARRLRERLRLILQHSHAHVRWQSSRAQPSQALGRRPGTPSEHEIGRGEFLFSFAEFLAAVERLRLEAHRIPGGCASVVSSRADAVVASLGCDDPRVEVLLGQAIDTAEPREGPPPPPTVGGSAARPPPSLDAATSALQLRAVGELMLQEESRCTQYARFCRLLAVCAPEPLADGAPTGQRTEQERALPAAAAALQLQPLR